MTRKLATESMYVWRIRPVPGEAIRALAWWLKEFRWPRQRLIRSSSLRYRTVLWLLRITDDRQWTMADMTRAQRFWRKRLGCRRREWILKEKP
jgi:hypothetical protein